MADNPIKHEDIIQPGNPFDQTIKGLQQMIKLYNKLLKDIKKTAQEYSMTIEKQNTATKEGKKNITNMAKAVDKLSVKEKEMNRIKKQLVSQQAKLNVMGTEEYRQTIKNAEAIRKKNAEIRKAVRAQDAGTKSTNRWAKALGSFAFKFNALGNIMANVASFMSRQLRKAFTSTFNIVKDFDQAMADVKAVTNATRNEFDKLSKSAISLGGRTKFTATQVAELQKAYAKLGFTTDEILKAQGATLDLAAATGTDLARAAEVTGITLRQFGLDSAETTRVVDVMAKSFTTSALDMEKFAEAMKMAGPAARASNISLERATAMIGQLADAGISGTMAGTALRSIMLNLSSGAGTLSEKIKALAAKGLTLAGATEEVQRRAATALIVLGNGVDTIDDFTLALENAAGASQKMADIQLETLAGSITLVKSAWEGMINTMLYTEENLSGIKWALGGIITLLNAMALKAETGFKLSETLAMEKSMQEAIQYVMEDLKGAPLTLEKIKKNGKGVLQTFKQAGIDIWRQMFPKPQQEMLENIDALVKKLGDLSDVTQEDGAFEPWMGTEDMEIQLKIYGDTEFDYKDHLKRMEKLRGAYEADGVEETKEAEEKKLEYFQSGLEIASQAATSFSNIFAKQKEKELSAVGDNAAKREAIEKKYAKKEQQLAIVSAIISTAQGVARAFGDFPFPYSLIPAALVAGLGAAEISTIASQEFAEGGSGLLGDQGGVLPGKPHSQGGVNLGAIGEAERGEYFGIVNKQMSKKYAGDLPGIFDSLNNGAFHEVWSRGASGHDPYTKKMYELMKEIPHTVQSGPRIEKYHGRTRIING